MSFSGPIMPGHLAASECAPDATTYQPDSWYLTYEGKNGARRGTRVLFITPGLGLQRS
jgi:hypothetical protein